MANSSAIVRHMVSVLTISQKKEKRGNEESLYLFLLFNKIFFLIDFS